MLDVSAWPSVSLGDLCTVVRGGSPRPAGDPRFFGGSFIPWLTVAAITNVSSSKLVITETVGHLTEAGSRRSRRFRPGTVVIANSGWKCGVAKILGFECCGNDGVAGLENLTGADPRFITYWINSQTEQLRARSAAGNEQPNLNTDRIAGLAVPCPPLEEQEAIAEALSDADALIEGLERLIAKKRLIKQGAMQDLLTAKRRLPGFSGEWVQHAIQDLAHVDPEALGSGTSKDHEINYISLEDVSRGVLNGWTEIRFGDAPSRARRVLRKHDVLLGTVRPNLQSHHLFERDGNDWIGSTGFAVLRARHEICSPRYLFELIMSEIVGRQIDELIAGSNYPAISNRDVRKLRISLPALGEQAAISEVLSDMDAEIQALESRLEKARQVKEGMMQNLLTGRIRLV